MDTLDLNQNSVKNFLDRDGIYTYTTKTPAVICYELEEGGHYEDYEDWDDLDCGYNPYMGCYDYDC